MTNPTPWVDSVKRSKTLSIFLANEGSMPAPAVTAFGDAVTAFNNFSNDICVSLSRIASSASQQDQNNANIKAFGARFQKFKRTVNLGGVDVQVECDAMAGHGNTATQPDNNNKIIGAASVAPIEISLFNPADPGMIKLVFLHEFIHAAGLDSNDLHDPDGKDIFRAVQPANAGSNPPNPLIGQHTKSLLKRIWCPASGRRASLDLESRPHQDQAAA
jgi:hypothetical protein